MAKKQFKAESKRLLDLMIHSIYTHKEIFLRELISNASDAIDKLYYRSLTENNTGLSREDFEIRLDINSEERILTISDNGIGMTREELESNLGTIARSGSLAFKKEKEAKDEIDIIGQFGVGFYSSFMVSSNVTVISKAYGEEQAYMWESTGSDGYTLTECDKPNYGTEIILKIKENHEDENYDEFLQEYKIRGLVKKYSDYIRYPIKMNTQQRKLKEGTEDEYETVIEDQTLNSMVPIWRKNKNEISTEEYHHFYQEKFYDFSDPAKVIHTNVEGVSTYNALLYIPGKAPYNYYTKEYEKGLQLYSSGVLIMDKCADLLPDYFSFVKGLVDSQDLSLNISREMLQHDRQLKAIASRLEKKIKSELLEMQKTEREKYEDFFKNFGLQLKYGLYDRFGANKEMLQDLVLFYSSTENKPVTLSEYVSRMKLDQKYIYYACGDSVERIERLPQTEMLKDKGFEILYFTDDIDEFAIRMLHEFDGKEFRSVSSDDLGFEESETDKEAARKEAEDYQDMFAFMKETLGDKVSEVRLSQRLKTHPVCLASSGGLSIEMEKILNAMPNDEKVKAEKVLEINAGHQVLQALKKAYESDKEKAGKYTELLYNQALLIEGVPIEDPVAFSNAICDLII
ncbi:molecular chaperone HtpG [Sinanaerobacter chloroacetimidivorans]|uniref:Chaperone protein HtpG n=1 Tax=Sinanaerobacter chloroacetimidivorans TaxID=2818044 RepID=A0A8J8B2H0_9FIRM|nr:molecular chaperone HtpG [Sinanaerobacter chloroacetimidivorans]MBR0598717.1 molecular chaperone HtpG [Sinanaerobacter chloroacetimidivorans]